MKNEPENIITRPGISFETLTAAGIRHVEADEAEQICGKPEPGLWIPFYHLTGAPVIEKDKPYGRLRLNSPPHGGGKYHQEKGTNVHAYLPPGLNKFEQALDLVIVEGEFKALSLVEAGIPAIGISGFYGWKYEHKELGTQLVAELLLAIHELSPNRILFLGDSDTALNYQFSDAATKLAKHAGQPILLPRIALDGPGKGVDDCRDKLKDNFPEWWKNLVKSAVSVSKTITTCTLARLLCEKELEPLSQFHGEQEADALARMIKLLASMRKSEVDREKLLKQISKKMDVPVLALRKSVKACLSDERERKYEESKDPREDDPEWGPIVTKEIKDQEGNLTDIVPSERYFGKLYCDENRILYESNESRFYQYCDTTGLWSKLTRASLQQLLGDRMILIAKERKDYPMLENKTDIQFLNAVTRQIQGMSERNDAFKGKKSFVHCASSMISVNEEQIEEYKFDHEFYSRNNLSIDPNFSSPPTRFLEDLVIPAVHEEDVIFLQKFFGLFILQDNPAQQFLILSGLPGRGKTQLIDVMTRLVGNKNIGTLRTAHLSDRFELGRSLGKTLLIGSDVPGDFLEEKGASTLKAMVGGDPINVELKNKNGSFSMNGRINVALTCNERLTVRIASDAGAWERRLAIIKFEGPIPKNKIPDFGKVLFEEEGPQILAWAIEGVQLLMQDLKKYARIHRTERQLNIVKDLLRESQSLEHFVQSKIESARGIGDVTKNDVLDAYANFCHINGWAPMPRSRQHHELSELILKHHRSSLTRSLNRNGKNAQGWRNLRLKPEGNLI